MSRLLINEPPLQMLPTLALAIGVNEALFLQQLHYRLNSSRIRDGRRWYNRSYEEWQAMEMRFMSLRTVKRVVTSLRQSSLIETTDIYNRKDDRTLWYTINYEALDALELDGDLSGGGFMPLGEVRPVQESPEDPDIDAPDEDEDEAEKAAPSGECQIDTQESAKAEKAAPSGECQNGTQLNIDSAKLAPSIDSANLALSLPKEELLTTPPPTPSVNDDLSVVVAVVGKTWEDWKEHLRITSEPAIRLTLGQWKAWLDEGLQDDLKTGVNAVIMMGARASDPSAVLRGRMGKAQMRNSSNVARRAADAAREAVAAPTEGTRLKAPTGQVLTVDYAQDGFVFWKENAPEAALAHVAGWPRAEAQA